MRSLVGATGGALSVFGAIRRDPIGLALGTAGLGLVARGLTNLPLRRIVGVGAGRRAVDIQKTIHVQAPLERVFRLWDNYENFPRFMSHVRQVSEIAPGWSHWSVAGPGGMPIEWDAIITERIPNKLLAWKTVPGSVVQHAGIIRFERDADGGTRVDIKMSYNPVAGAIGHGVAELPGTDPKTRMDQDLVAMKTFIETGAVDLEKTSAPAEEWLERG